MVRKARAVLNKEETALRNHPGDVFTPPNLFEDAVGLFWGIWETRDYMRARFGVVDTLRECFSTHRLAVQESLHHLLDMLRLDRSDNMELRDMVPALFIRLGRDQDAYDFAKWWTTRGRGYHWGDMSLPHLHLKDEDAFEEPKWWIGSQVGLSHASAVMLVKVRILGDLRSMQNAERALQVRGGGELVLPREIIDQIRGELVSGGVVAKRRDLIHGSVAKLEVIIATIQAQIRSIFKAIDSANHYFWYIMTKDPEDLLEEKRPSDYSLGSSEEAMIMAQNSYIAWKQDPEAEQVLWDLCYAKDKEILDRERLEYPEADKMWDLWCAEQKEFLECYMWWQAFKN